MKVETQHFLFFCQYDETSTWPCVKGQGNTINCVMLMIFSLCSTTASCTLILRDLSEMRYSWSQGQILKVKVTMRIKQKVMFRLYDFLWASWIAVIVRMLFVYNQWVCNVMTLTQSESHGAHVHYIVSSLYLFPGNLDLCDTRIYPDSAVLFLPYLPHVSWCL